MTIDIWSDIRCPFCYIGKRRFEQALAGFPHKDQVAVNWHSFELDPSLQTDTSLNIYDYLAKRKGFPRSHAVQLHAQMQQSAIEAGLQFNFDQTIIANSFNAHRLIQLANSKGLAGQAEESLFRAHFEEGRNIDDDQELLRIGVAIGLEETAVAALLSSTSFTSEVRADEAEAAELGINGVPFFVFNNQYGVSGAQGSDVFLQVLEQTWQETTALSPEPVPAAAGSCEEDACNV